MEEIILHFFSRLLAVHQGRSIRNSLYQIPVLLQQLLVFLRHFRRKADNCRPLLWTFRALICLPIKGYADTEYSEVNHCTCVK